MSSHSLSIMYKEKNLKYGIHQLIRKITIKQCDRCDNVGGQD